MNTIECGNSSGYAMQSASLLARDAAEGRRHPQAEAETGTPEPLTVPALPVLPSIVAAIAAFAPGDPDVPDLTAPSDSPTVDLFA